jgi:Kef-type K+ transport system membrane component KefB
MDPASGLPAQLEYVLLLFALFVVPRALQRLRIPSAITSFALGAVSGMGLGLFQGDATLGLLATFGIVGLFLFAGLDVEIARLREQAGILFQHLALMLATLVLVAWGTHRLTGLDPRAATLVSLALLTPSAGFILDSLDRLNVASEAREWIKSKAIASELVCLTILFATLRSTSVGNLLTSTAALVGLIVLLPLLFRAFAAFIVPHAPRSEFAFLMMTAVACAAVTYQLGVYYLVGAFVVGIAARRLRTRIPSIASENMLHAVESFASLFVPFYFFVAGTRLRSEHFGWEALLTGVILILLLAPLRLLTNWGHRRLALGESFGRSLSVGAPILPTLVFTLVIAEILVDRFAAPAWLFGGLIVYTVVNSFLPVLLVGMRLPGRRRSS